MMTDMSNVNGSGKVLLRPREGRVIAGVCAGIGRYFGLDSTLIRLALAVITVFTGGFGVLAYLVAWVVIPEEGESGSIADNLMSKYQK